MATRYNERSNYASTSQNKKYLELYDPPLTAETLSAQTVTFVIEAKYNRRPDLLANDMYGSPKVWWVFVHYNRDQLKDPVMDFTSGLKIKAPKTFRVLGAT